MCTPHILYSIMHRRACNAEEGLLTRPRDSKLSQLEPLPLLPAPLVSHALRLQRCSHILPLGGAPALGAGGRSGRPERVNPPAPTLPFFPFPPSLSSWPQRPQCSKAPCRVPELASPRARAVPWCQSIPNGNSFAASPQLSPVPRTPLVTGDSPLSEALLDGIHVMVMHVGSDDPSWVLTSPLCSLVSRCVSLV